MALMALLAFIFGCLKIPVADPGSHPARIVVYVETWADCGEVLKTLRQMDQQAWFGYIREPLDPGPFWELRAEVMEQGKPVMRLGAAKSQEFSPRAGARVKTQAEYLAPPGKMSLRLSLGAWVRRVYRPLYPRVRRRFWGYYPWDDWIADPPQMQTRRLESAAMVKELELNLAPGQSHEVRFFKEPGLGMCSPR